MLSSSLVFGRGCSGGRPGEPKASLATSLPLDRPMDALPDSDINAFPMESPRLRRMDMDFLRGVWPGGGNVLPLEKGLGCAENVVEQGGRAVTPTGTCGGLVLWTAV